MSNHVLIRLIRFVSRFTVHLYNAIYFSTTFSTPYKRFTKILHFAFWDLNRASLAILDCSVEAIFLHSRSHRQISRPGSVLRHDSHQGRGAAIETRKTSNSACKFLRFTNRPRSIEVQIPIPTYTGAPWRRATRKPNLRRSPRRDRATAGIRYRRGRRGTGHP